MTLAFSCEVVHEKL